MFLDKKSLMMLIQIFQALYSFWTFRYSYKEFRFASLKY